jgi:hypothetical protein
MLEETAVLLEQAAQMVRPVAVEPCRQDQMMCPLDDADRIDLHEAEAFDEPVDAAGIGAPRRIVEQSLPGQEQPAGGCGGNERQV